MQLACEAHDVLRSACAMRPLDEAALFERWNARGSALASYLLEITALILRTPDRVSRDGGMLLDKIEDVTSQKGTGRWTVEAALEMGVAVPTLAAGLDARYVSSDKERRIAVAARMEAAGAPPPGMTREAMALLGVTTPADVAAARTKLAECLADLLWCSKTAIYAQGFALLSAKEAQRRWGHNLAELARIWKGGCIIRAAALDDVRRAFTAEPSLPSLLLDDATAKALASRLSGWRTAVAAAALCGVAVPAAGASLAYVDAMRAARSPASLAAAQRDFFGAHGYARTDAPGAHHTTLWG